MLYVMPSVDDIKKVRSVDIRDKTFKFPAEDGQFCTSSSKSWRLFATKNCMPSKNNRKIPVLWVMASL